MLKTKSENGRIIKIPSVSPNKKKVKRSKLVGALTTKTTFKSEWKKEFPFITSVPNDVSQ